MAELRTFTVFGTAEHTLKYDKAELPFFTKKEMDDKYPNSAYSVVGETKKKVKNKRVIGKLVVGSETYDVVRAGTYGKLLHATKGYAPVGGDSYVALLKSRAAFLILLLLLLGGLIAGGILLGNMLTRQPAPVENPTKAPDPYIEPMTEESEPRATSEAGGGSVSMIYTLEASIQQGSDTATIYFKNPSASNHDVAIDFYILSGGERVLLGSTGLVPPGNGISQVKIDTSEIALAPGKYVGLYKVGYYNPETGEKALVGSEITDVVITVKE
jgi:hypothetical protein